MAEQTGIKEQLATALDGLGAYAEDAARKQRNAQKEAGNIPDYKGTVPTPKGYVTIRRKFMIDPAKYRSPNYVPIGENDDPKQIEMPTGIVGMEEVVEEEVSDLGDGNSEEKQAKSTAQDSLASALMSIAHDAEPHVAEERDRIREQEPDYGDSHYMAPAEVPPPITGEDSLPCIAQDAKTPNKPKIRCKSTFKDCKAKNPLYCPYHGAALIQADVERQLRSMGLNALLEVEAGEDDGRYYFMAVTVPEGDKDKAEKIIDQLLKTPGFSVQEATSAENVGAGMTELDTYFNVDVLRSDLPPDEQNSKDNLNDVLQKALDAKNAMLDRVFDGIDAKEKTAKWLDGFFYAIANRLYDKYPTSIVNNAYENAEVNKARDGFHAAWNEMHEAEKVLNESVKNGSPDDVVNAAAKTMEDMVSLFEREAEKFKAANTDFIERVENADAIDPNAVEIGNMRNAIDDLVAESKSLYERAAKFALDHAGKDADDIAERAAQFSMRMQDISDSFAEMVEKKNEDMKKDPDSVKGKATAHILDLLMKTFKEKTIPRATKERDDIRAAIDHARVSNEDKEIQRIKDRLKDYFPKAMEETRAKVFEEAKKAGIIPTGFSPKDLDAALSDAFKKATAGLDKKKADQIMSAYVSPACREEFTKSADEMEEARLAVDNLDSITEHMDRDALRQYEYDMLGYVRAYGRSAVSLIHGYEKAIKKAGMESRGDNESGEARAMALDESIEDAMKHSDPYVALQYLDSLYMGMKKGQRPSHGRIPSPMAGDSCKFNACAMKEMMRVYPKIGDAVREVMFSMRKPHKGNAAEVIYSLRLSDHKILWREIRVPYKSGMECNFNPSKGEPIPYSVTEYATSSNVANVANMMHEIGHIFYRNDGNDARWNAMLDGMKDRAWEHSVSRYPDTYRKRDDRRNELHSECMSLYTMPTYKKGTLPQEVEDYMESILR